MGSDSHSPKSALVETGKLCKSESPLSKIEGPRAQQEETQYRGSIVNSTKYLDLRRRGQARSFFISIDCLHLCAEL